MQPGCLLACARALAGSVLARWNQFSSYYISDPF